VTQSWRSQISLDNSEIHSCYRKSTLESMLTSLYGTQQSRNGLVIRKSEMCKRGITISVSNPTSTVRNPYPGRAGGRTEWHFPTGHRSWSLVNELFLNEITIRANKLTWRRVNECSWRQNDQPTQHPTIWIPSDWTTCRSGEEADSKPRRKLANNWRWRLLRVQGSWWEQLQAHWQGG